MAVNSTQNKNCENTKIGRDFQYLTAKLLEVVYRTSFALEVPINIGTPPKPHKFDCVSTNNNIVVECKCYSWTSSGNIPSAKISFLNQSILYAQHLPPHVIKIIAMKRACHAKRNETLAEYYYRTHQHLLNGIVLLEIDSDNKTIREIKNTF